MLGAMKDAYSLCNTVLKAMLLSIAGICNRELTGSMYIFDELFSDL